MRQINRVLYVLHDKTHLSCENENIVIKKYGEDGSVSKNYIPARYVEIIVVMGDISVSTRLLKFCADNGILLSFVSVYGNYYARCFGKIKGNVHLRKAQCDFYNDDMFRLSFSKNIITGKLLNSIGVLSYYAHNSNVCVDTQIDFLKQNVSDLLHAKDLESVRGIEAVSASMYYSVFDDLLSHVPDDMKFDHRSRRPPENNFNALLSYLYMLCHLNCVAALETFGLDSYLGYMHEMRPGRESLASDLIEEFRAPFVDRFVLSLVNLGMISSSDFDADQTGIFLNQDGRKKLFQLWEDEKKKLVWHPLLKTKVEKRLVPYLQAQYLADCIRGRISEYPPWVWDWKK